MDAVVTITGLEDVQRMLAEAPRDVVARGYLKALQAGANVIADEVEIHTPVKAEDTGGLLDKGVLRESLMIAIELDAQFRGGIAKVGFGKNGHVALWVEYGHNMVGHKPGKKPSGVVPAHPFMRPAADTKANAAIDAFATSLAQTVRENFPQGSKP